MTIRGHRALQNWGEGTSLPFGQGGAGTTPTTGDATWLHTFYPGTNWSTRGGSFAPAWSLGIPAPSTGPAGSASSLAAVADVQDWLDNPAQNFGWLLKTEELQVQSALRFESREATSNPPRLTIAYIANGQKATWGSGCLAKSSSARAMLIRGAVHRT